MLLLVCYPVLQVRPRFVAAPALSVKLHLRDGRTDRLSVRPSLRWRLTLRASLARCAGKSSVQTRRRNVRLLSRPITAVHRRSPCTSVRRLDQQGGIFDPLLSVSWWFRMHSVHGPSLWPARGFGTLYKTAWEIRILAGTTSDVCWRRIYFHCTEAFSILGMFQDDSLYKLNYLLHVLTYETSRQKLQPNFLFNVAPYTLY